jgi:hypothetical protein
VCEPRCERYRSMSGFVISTTGVVDPMYAWRSRRWRCQVGGPWPAWQPTRMTTSPNPYRGFRFPAEIIEHAVWLYHCFSLSLRDVN